MTHYQLSLLQSSQKALIWNLDLPYHSQPQSCHSSTLDTTLYPHRGVQSPIQFVLQAHTRAICDINWAVFNVDVLATCGIDSWTYTFDLRVGGRTAVQGFCAWNSPATQVKWNRQDPHVLATSHDSRVLVWDTRNPAEPIIEFKAHDEKIYGIDWSRRSSDGLVTCSLDRTVKFWSTKSVQNPQKIIQTSSPVRRARHLPFGRGVMTLPQRSDHVLKMWNEDQLTAPIASFVGHQDTVREFVWRTRGGSNLNYDDRQFQLVTWGNDRKLRLWPISPATLEKAGFRPGAPIDVRVTRKATSANRSFRQSSLAVPSAPSPSSMSISPFRSGRASHASSYTSSSVATRIIQIHPASLRNDLKTPCKVSQTEQAQLPNSLIMKDHLPRYPAYMTPQATPGPLNTPSHRLAWMEGVKLYRPAIPGSDTGHMPSTPGLTVPHKSRSCSRERHTEGSLDGQSIPPSVESLTLGEELTAAQRNFPRVIFEQIIVQGRTCSVGFYGPWAACGGIAFLRAMFSFPKSYPELKPPSIEIERSSDVSARTRAFLLKSARELMRDHVQNRKPAIFESCLRFLLGDRSVLEAGKVDRFVDSDEEIRDPVAGMRPDVLQNNVSVPSPRQAGASFTPQGRLIIFYCSDFRTVPSPKIAMFPKRNHKFEAFGSLLMSRIHRAPAFEDESESDEALRMPMSYRIRMQSGRVSSGALPIPAREISTLVTIRFLNMLKPPPIPNLRSGDPLAVIDSALQLTLVDADPIRHRTWLMMRVFIETFREFPDLASSPANADVLSEILRYLRGIHDLETLGYIACVLELTRRARAPLITQPEHEKDQVHKPYPQTDYFNSKVVGNSDPKLSSQSLKTPDIPVAAEPSQSPSKGSWSNFFLSLTQSANLSNPAPITRSSNSSTTQAYSVTTPSPDRAVAMLKQQLASRQPSTDVLGKREAKSRNETNADGSNKNLVLTGMPSKRSEAFEMKPPMRRKRRIQVRDVANSQPLGEQSILDDPVVLAELEGYKHYLCDLLMRRGELVERTFVIKLLRVGTTQEPINEIFTRRAQLLSGIDHQSEVELVVLCPTCGSGLPSEGTGGCLQCHRARAVTPCSVCHKPVPKLARDCVKCLHGGHLECMSKWWDIGQSCPTGCGCECTSTGPSLGRSIENHLGRSQSMDLSDSNSIRTMTSNTSEFRRASNTTISSIQ